jgi:uncharacterized sulfatase
MRTIKNYHCLLLLAIFLFHLQTVQSQVKPKYNVLFIVADDLNDRLSCLGWPEVVTPNIQRLLSHGMLFKRAYAQYPLCSPSRTSFLTGWRPDHTGIFDDYIDPNTVLSSDVKYLPLYFKQFGYDIERYGKIMHGPFENDITWDYAEPDKDQSLTITAKNSALNEFPSGKWWVRSNTDSFTWDRTIAKHIVKRLRQTRTLPFFYGLGFINPHNPFTPHLSAWNKVGDPSVQELLPLDSNGTTSPTFKGNGSGNIVLPSTPLNDRSDVPPIAFTVGQLIPTSYEWKRIIHAYNGDVVDTDIQLGLVLDEFDRQNLWANTIVIFIGDHGQHLGEHEGLWKKNTLFEESVHIPLIVCMPGKKGGRTCSKLVELEDIYPTLLELAGLPKLSNLEGSSFAPLLDKPDFEWKRATFSQVKRVKAKGDVVGRSIRTKQYRYTSWDSLGEELYDHYADPHEYINLAKKLKYKPILDSMRKILAEGWKKSRPPVYKLKTFYRDFDKDGYGNFRDSIHAYAPSSGYVLDNTDCKDNNANVHPGATEICDGIDNNCDGRIDENKPPALINALGNLDICTTGSVTLETNAGRGYKYQWRRDDAPILNATKIRYTATVTGNYKVVVKDSTGCSTVSKRATVVNSCAMQISKNLSIQSVSKDLLVYPNPSNGNITVTCYSNSQGKILLKIFDAGGKLVFTSSETTTKGSFMKKLFLSNLKQGVYYLSIYNNEEEKHASFTIVR